MTAGRAIRSFVADASPRAGAPVPVAVVWVYMAVCTALGLGYAVGWLPDTTPAVVLVAAVPLAGWYGPRRNGARPHWPWVAIAGAGLVWAAAAAAREALAPLGDLTASRSLVPDALGLPGYALLSSALLGLIRARDSRAHRGALLDGVLVGLGAFVVAWEAFLRRTLEVPDVWVVAQLSVASYPVLDCVLIALACRLAFGGGTRSTSYLLVLASLVLVTVGDITYVFAELGADVFSPMVDFPYTLAVATLGAAALHPSVGAGHQPRPQGQNLTRPRLLLVAAALLIPAGIVVADRPIGEPLDLLLATVVVALGVLAVARLLLSTAQQARSERRLAHRATHDDLTGLPNRALVLDVLERAIALGAASEAAVLFLDLDQFKLVNDSMGHAVGDELLVAVAARLQGTVGDPHVTGRIGGDEFAVVLRAGADEAQAIAERVREALHAPFRLSVGEVFTTASIGLRVVDAAVTRTATDVLRDADTAMYGAKGSGRNTVAVFNHQMRDRIERRVGLERELRTALEDHRIVAHFQPLVSLPDGTPTGFEALARWTGGPSPAEFIPVAEESGLIVALGAAVLDRACAHLARWRESVPGLERAHVSVNLSVRQLHDSDVAAVVLDTLRRHQLPGDALWLEITESVMMDDSRDVLTVLNELRRLGVRLSVDDFGTGFSSLSYLKRFPVSRVKIDRSFVSGLGTAGSDDSLVAAIVGLTDALGLTTIGEGVESIEQARRLYELGCPHAQGYYFARPLPPEEVPARVAHLRSGALALPEVARDATVVPLRDRTRSTG